MKITRREFLRTSAAVSAATLATACAAPTAAPEPTPAPTSAPAPTTAPAVQPTEPSAAPTVAPEPTAEPSRYREAPMLAERVAAGELPPLDERLPLNPMVLASMDGSIGNYRGVIRRGMKGLADSAGPDKMRRETLVYYDPDLNLRENVAESWETSDDATVFTLHLREGMKWSDGTDFDVAGIRYWYEQELLNPTLTPAINREWTTGDAQTVVEVDFPDDYTVAFTFADPYPLFVYKLAEDQPWSPGHYLSQFHMDLTDDQDALKTAVAEEGFDTWDQYYWEKNTWQTNPDIPQVGPWTSQNSMADELFVMQRNPYFYQVDPDGNQLPYIDAMNHRRFETPDVFNMWVVNGEIDFQNRHVDIANYTLFKESEAKGDYTVQFGANDATSVLCLNQTCPNPNLREFFRNRNVRVAISHAINREEINDLIFDGLATPRQYSPSEASAQFYAKLSNAYLEYDPDMANETLDAEGYAERSADGFRVYPDGSGEEISFVLESMNKADSDLYEMVGRYLSDVGIKTVYKLFERSLVYEHIAANTLEAAVENASRAVLPLVDPSFFLDIAGHKLFGIAWRHYYYNPDDPVAERPPDGHYIWTMWELWDQIKVTADMDKQNGMFRQILDIWVEELPMPGIVGEFPGPFIVKNGLRAFKPGYRMPLSNPLKHGGFVPAQTYYWEEPEKHG